MPSTPPLQNPFAYGRELPPGSLVDREQELARIIQIMENRGRLFLVGPRRFGKTSLLREAEYQLSTKDHVVLRYDAEKYETLHLLAQALLTGATRKLVGSVERAGKAAARFFGRLRPEVSYSGLDQSVSVSIGPEPSSGETSVPLLMDVLDGINQMAAAAGRRVSIVIDEFQQVILIGGRVAEGQLRSVIQTHDHLGYVFAGSKQRLLMEMISAADRPFWQSGDRLFLGPIPRLEFAPFLRAGFAAGEIIVQDDALMHIMDCAEDVPHNIQMLAHACWDLARRTQQELTTTVVDNALERIIFENDPFYTQLWTNLTIAQKKTLKAVIEAKGVNLRSQAVTRTYGIAPSTIQKTLGVLEDRGITRSEETLGHVRVRLEDPFLGAWLRISQVQH